MIGGRDRRVCNANLLTRRSLLRSGLAALAAAPWAKALAASSPSTHRSLFDVEASRKLAHRWTLTAGAQNVLNTYPEEYPGAAAGVGNRFGQFTPFGFNGGFYYTRLGYSW